MKKLTKIWLPVLMAAASFGVPAAGTTDFGNIVFIGDSITQANGTKAVSYRYQLWKIFVDNDVDYKPLGTMNQYASGSNQVTTSTLIKDYRGQSFDNTSEGHSSWRAAWLTIPTNNTVTATSTFPNFTVDTSKSLSDYIDGYGQTPNTATILMGINDISQGANFTWTAENSIKGIVDVLQTKNADMKIYVFSLLPDARAISTWTLDSSSGTYSTAWDAVVAYNKILKTTVESWKDPNVVYYDITAGFDPNAHTYDSLHPSTQGELIIAGNMARAMGLEQRTNGLERRDGNALAQQASFVNDGGNAKISIAGTQSTFDNSSNSNNTISITCDGNLAFNSTSYWGQLSLSTFETAGTAQNMTVSMSLKMLESDNASGNYLGIAVGNGAGTLLLYVGADGIYRESTVNANLLYGCVTDAYKTGFMAAAFQDLTISYVADGTGAGNGFYVWLGDQLIGEALAGTSQDNFKTNDFYTSIVLGDFLNEASCVAEIAALSYEIGTAYAPISLIPEPSLFGVFAGTLALMLAGTRRRRRGNGIRGGQASSPASTPQ